MRTWRRALVTGASAGIGEGFADELARLGVELILIGRDRVALDAVAARARATGVGVEAVVADLACERDLQCIESMIRDADPMVDLLVNNAGTGQYGSFLELPVERAIEVVRVNDIALVRLTRTAGPRMVSAGRGCVIQVSSTASATPGPYQAVYAASKAFVSSFGQALSEELKSTGVTCTTVLPGYTRTKYFERVGLSVDIPEAQWMTPTEVATAALEGARAGRVLVIPGANNRRWIATSVQFPSLLAGRMLQVVDRSRRLARRVVPRRGRSGQPAGSTE